MTLNKLKIYLIQAFLLLSLSNIIATETNKNSLIDTTKLFSKRDMIQTVNINDTKRIKLQNNNEFIIENEGVYLLEGEILNSTIVVDTGDDSKVQLVLNNLSIINNNKPVIHVKSADKVYLTTIGTNVLTVNNNYATDQDAVIYSKDDLVLNGTGSLKITSKKGNGVTAKDDLKITGGELIVNALLDGLEANDSIRITGAKITIDTPKDAIHSENKKDLSLGYVYIKDGSIEINAGDDAIRGNSFVQIDGGTINIKTSKEGIEATHVQINGGKINIYATDDGINASKKTPRNMLIEVYGGDIFIEMAKGDTDAFDSNGDLFIYGGNISVIAQSAFDADGEAKLLSGTVKVNGKQVSELPVTRFGPRRTK